VQEILELILLPKQQRTYLVDPQSLIEAVIDSRALDRILLAVMRGKEAVLGVENGLLRRGVDGGVGREGGDAEIMDHFACKLVESEGAGVRSVVCEKRREKRLARAPSRCADFSVEEDKQR
jgi:hypothetical protein